MVSKKKKKELVSGISGIIVLVFVVLLFVLSLGMIDNVLTWIEESFILDAFGAQLVLFFALIAGIGIFSVIAWSNAPKRSSKSKK